VKRIYLMQDIFEKIIRGYNVHFLPYELLEISKSYHSFYQRERIVDEVDRDRTLKRLFINRCIKNLIGFCLDKMRVTAPEEM
jgi:arginyl-tRNA synthetase